jgi:LCP family protein required for cell wall assembly
MGNSTDKRGGKMSKKQLRQKRKMERTIGMVLTVVLLICIGVFIGLLSYLNLLPGIYLGAIVVVLLLVLAYVWLSQFTKAHMIGKVLAVLLSIILAFGSYYLLATSSMLGNITTNEEEVDVMSVVVLAEDKAVSVNDTVDYTYGINSSYQQTNTQKAIADINEQLDADISVVEYQNWYELVDALYTGEVGAIIFSESVRGVIEDNDFYASFSSVTRVLGYSEIVSNAVIEAPDKEITDETFTVLISGNDSTGKINTTGRSDVNIIATVNPETNQVLLVTTPRDLWLTLYYGDGTDSGSYKDKLTHASTNGLACSMATLEALYDIDIDYYVRINFTGFENLVDALGGIEVESDYAFTPYAYSDYPYTYVKGINKLNGSQALIFARERHAFADGDFQRNKNQIRVIEAIAKKATSASMLMNYTGVMSSLKDVLATNIPQEQIAKLVKKQLSDMNSWEFKSYSVTGSTGTEYCLALGSNASIVYVDSNSISVASAKMKAVANGEDPDLIGDTAN